MIFRMESHPFSEMVNKGGLKKLEALPLPMKDWRKLENICCWSMIKGTQPGYPLSLPARQQVMEDGDKQRWYQQAPFISCSQAHLRYSRLIEPGVDSTTMCAMSGAQND